MVVDELTPTGRVFAAVVPPPEVVAALADRLESYEIPGRLVPPANWHVTLRYIGEVEPVAYERWLGELSSLRPDGPFRVTLSGIGTFPNPRRATVVWVGVDHVGRLDDLVAMVDGAAEAAGLGAEERPFVPHLTISRVRPPENVVSLLDRIGDWHFTFRVEEFHLMAASGSRYRVYESFPV